MKKIYLILTVVLSSLLMTSCSTSHDDFDEDRETIIGFTLGAALELPIPPGVTFNFPVTYYVTEASTADRTFQVIVVDEETTLTSDNYSFETELVVPAGEKVGQFFVGLTNNSLTDEFADLVIAFAGNENLTSGNKATLSIKSN